MARTEEDRRIERMGKYFAEGVLSTIAKWFVLCALFIAVVGALHGDFDKDPTDPASGRSGLKLRTDSGTGCQYLETREGMLSPRLAADGRQVCK